MSGSAEQTDRIVLAHSPMPLDFRIILPVFGVVFTAIGLFALFQLIVALIGLAFGRDVEGNFLLGVAITVMFCGLGGVALWAFFRPVEDLVFDGANGALTSTRRYRFGRQKIVTYPLADLAPPEVVWQDDGDRYDGGVWLLQITLPDGRKFDYTSQADTASGEKRASEILRDNILALMGP